MVTPGSTNADRAKVDEHEIAYRTCLTLSRTLPPAMVGVMVNFKSNLKSLSSFQVANLKKKLPLTWMLWINWQQSEDLGSWVSHTEEHYRTLALRLGLEKKRTGKQLRML